MGQKELAEHWRPLHQEHHGPPVPDFLLSAPSQRTLVVVSGLPAGRCVQRSLSLALSLSLWFPILGGCMGVEWRSGGVVCARLPEYCAARVCVCVCVRTAHAYCRSRLPSTGGSLFSGRASWQVSRSVPVLPLGVVVV